MLWRIPLIWWVIAANRKGILTYPPYNQLPYRYLSIYQLLEMCLTWNKAAVVQPSFRYSLQKGILVSLHMLLLAEFINTTLWIAVESSVVHGYKKFRVVWLQFFRRPVRRVLEGHVGTHDFSLFSRPS